MKFEIVDFYYDPLNRPKSQYIGTMHIYCIDLGLDIRGVSVYKKGGRIHFRIPSRKTIDRETKKKVVYPLISFTNSDTNKEIRTFFKEECVPYVAEILEKIKNFPRKK